MSRREIAILAGSDSDEKFAELTIRVVCVDCLKPCAVDKIPVSFGYGRCITVECACRFVALEIGPQIATCDGVATFISSQLDEVTPRVLQETRDAAERNALSLMDTVRALDRVLAQPAMRTEDASTRACCPFAAGVAGATPCPSCR